MQERADHPVAGLDEYRLDQLCLALVNQGYCVLDDAVPSALLQSLQLQATGLPRAQLRRAGTGREQQHQLDARVRSDLVHWLQPGTVASNGYLEFAERLREGMNSRLYLGLFDYEAHYACYEPGASYSRHRDAFAGRRNRIVSTVLYLNAQWQQELGGELLLYDEDGTLLQRIVPVLNRLVLFLSERFPHEVLPAQRDRYSIAGWFRVREN